MEAFVEEAATFEKCIEKIKSKYGPNVKITRRESQKKQYLLGLIEKEVIKVKFHLQNDPFDPNSEDDFELQTKKAEPVTIQTKAKAQTRFIPPDDETSRLDIMHNAASLSPAIKEQISPYLDNASKNKKKDSNESSSESASGEELQKLAQTVELLAKQISENGGSSEEHENIKKIEELLEENDFTPKYIRTIKERIKKDLSLAQLDDFDFLQKKVITWIAEAIKIKLENYTLADKGKVICLVGPTGIGKTTSIAKLAAYYVIEVSRKVGKLLDVKIVSTDGYRIGASDQMRKYCKHMKLPLVIPENSSELHKYLELYKDQADIVCIDTTGRSPSDYAKILEMQRFIDVIDKENSETYLAVSAVSKSMDIKEIMKQYSGFDYSSIIITKLDETVTVGSIISVLAENDVPISFITTGQKVPRDLRLASKNFILKKLKGFSVDVDFFDKEFDDELVISWVKKFW